MLIYSFQNVSPFCVVANIDFFISRINHLFEWLNRWILSSHQFLTLWIQISKHYLYSKLCSDFNNCSLALSYMRLNFSFYEFLTYSSEWKCWFFHCMNFSLLSFNGWFNVDNFLSLSSYSCFLILWIFFHLFQWMKLFIFFINFFPTISHFLLLFVLKNLDLAVLEFPTFYRFKCA